MGERLELALFIGLQGAGKSTFFERKLRSTHVHASKDLLGRSKKRHARELRLVEASLAQGRSVAVDDTNPTRALRAEFIALARRHGARVVGYWFPPDPRACLARNVQRSGRARVPPVALFATLKKLEPPLPEEGFDALVTVRAEAEALNEEPFAPAPGDSGAALPGR